MTTAEIQRTQERIGVEPDGFWGPISTDACKRHLRAMMPSPHPFPKEINVESFYGKHGVDGGFTPPTKKIVLPFAIYYKGSEVRALYPHVKCAASLLGVFERLAFAYPTEAARRASGILTYDGLYNPRLKRNGVTWSMHSWAIAIDLNMSKNGNMTHWPARATMPLEVMECFAKEGWMSAGAFWSRDAMHFQATCPP